MTGRELPPPFRDRPFLVSAARAADVTPARLRGSDLAMPFRGVRVPASSAAHPLAIVEQCRGYAPLLLPGDFFSHITAAQLWKIPLPLELDRSFQWKSGTGPVSGSGAPAAAGTGTAGVGTARAASTSTAGTAGAEPLHVSSTRPARPRHAGIVGHRAQADHPVVRRFGLPTSDAPSTWLALAPLMSEDDLIAAGDALVRVPRYPDAHDPRPYTTIDDLARTVARSRNRGVRKATAALEEVREGSDSPPETLLRLLLIRAGLPMAALNAAVLGLNGEWLGWGDLVWAEWRTLTEYDGEQHRTDPRQYARDERRIEEFARAEWHVVRVRKSGLTPSGQRDTIERVTRALRAGGWRG